MGMHGPHAHVRGQSHYVLSLYLSMKIFSRWAKAMKTQSYSRDDLIYKSPIQPRGAYFALTACMLLLLINGYVGTPCSRGSLSRG